MLILDVQTRWSSTHAMLGKWYLILHSWLTDLAAERALGYCRAVDRYARMQELTGLSDLEWLAIETVTKWLEIYRHSTAFMSASKLTTLSLVYSVFCRLQRRLCNELRTFNDDLPKDLKIGLQGALELLSSYFAKTDASPYYIWASCKCKYPRVRLGMAHHLCFSVLDPRITYRGMARAYAHDIQLARDVEDSRLQMKLHFLANYPSSNAALTPAHQATAPYLSDNNMFDIYVDDDQSFSSSGPEAELDEFLALRPEPQST
jgi:hypothetical protein